MRKNQYVVFLFLLFFLIIFSGAFGYCNWNVTIGGNIKKIICFFLFIFFFAYKRRIESANFKSIMLLFAFGPFISSIHTFFLYNQGFLSSIKVLCVNFVWLFYFLFHVWKVKESTLLNFILLVSLILVAIQILQNIFPQYAVFGIYDSEAMDSNDTIAEVRNGLLRFRNHFNGYFTMPIILILWCNIKNIKVWLVLSILMVSIYLTLTRQVIVAALFVLFLSYIWGEKVNLRKILKILFFIIFLYFLYDVLFAELTDKTSNELNNENIRVLAYEYYYDKVTKNFISFLIGYGMPCESSFSVEIFRAQIDFHLFASDVGFVGRWFYYGIYYILCCYYFLFLFIFKYRKYTPKYIQLFVVFTTVMSPMIFPMSGGLSYLIFAICAYITDLHINNSSLACSYYRI